MDGSAENSGGTPPYCHEAIWCRATDPPSTVAIDSQKRATAFAFFKVRTSPANVNRFGNRDAFHSRDGDGEDRASPLSVFMAIVKCTRRGLPGLRREQ
jgi:hypothetical protein